MWIKNVMDHVHLTQCLVMFKLHQTHVTVYCFSVYCVVKSQQTEFSTFSEPLVIYWKQCA